MLKSLLLASLLAADTPAVFQSQFAPQDFELSADANSPQWRSAPGVKISNDYLNRPINGPVTEVRSRWTKDNLYLLYICPYKDLNLKPDPTPTAETPKLWNWDVGEAFIGSASGSINRYRELQVSPQGEWVDLDIDRDHPKEQGGMRWNSGYSVKAKIDHVQRIWCGEMKIPFVAIDGQPGEKGKTFRAGIYRIAGAEPNREFYAWQPTGQKSFHVPQAFGTIRLQ